MVPPDPTLETLDDLLGLSEFVPCARHRCFGKGGGSGGGTNTVTSSAPPPQVMAAYQTAMNAAQSAASQPLQQYGGATIAGFTPDQLQAFQTVSGLQGAATPYLNSANSAIDASRTPLWSNVQQFSPSAVGQYQSPYTQNVVDATQAQFNNQNAQQQNQLVGSAISAGAWGGDRSAVAQAQLAGQQQLAQAPVIAGLENQGYSTALGEFNTQQQAQLGANEANSYLNSQAGFGYGNLANSAIGLPLEQANAQASAGSQQQALGQEALNVPYEQFLQQQSYPFQTAQYFANAAEGLGSGQGGTSTTTAPGASTGSQIFGGLLGTAGLLGETGAFGDAMGGAGWLLPLFAAKGGRISRDAGGNIPDLSVSYIPQFNPMVQHTIPNAPSIPQTQPTSSKQGLSDLGPLMKFIGGLMNGRPSNGNALDPSMSGALDMGGETNPMDVLPKFDDGGTVGGESPLGAQTSGQQMTSQASYLNQMSPQQLQNYILRLPPGNPMKQAAQQVLQQKRMMPNVGAPTQGGFGQPLMAPTMSFGGRLRRDAGGMTPEAEMQQEAASEPSYATSQPTVPQYQPVKPSPWEALAAAGFGMMAGTSPQAGVNIGRGALAGIENLEAQKKQTSQENYQQGELGLRGKGIDQEAKRLTAQIDQWQSENKVKQGELEKQQQQLVETTRHNKADESHAAATLSQTSQNEQWERQKPIPDGMGGFLIPNLKDPTHPQHVESTSDPDAAPLDPQGQPLTGEAYLKTLSPARAEMLKALDEGRMNYPSSFASAKPYYQHMMNQLYTYNPNASAQTAQAVRSFNTGKQGDQTRFLNVSVNHLDTLSQLADALGNNDTRALNSIKNTFKTQFGSDAPTNFDAAKQFVADEVVKGVVGAGGGQGDREKAQAAIISTASPQQLQGVIGTYKHLLAGQLGGLKQQYESSTGRKDYDRMLTGSAKAALSPTQQMPAGPPPEAIDFLKKNPSMAPMFEQKYGVPASQFMGAQ